MNLDELRRLHEQATPPPWTVDGIGDVHGEHPTDGWPTLIAETHYSDGALIAAARNALPVLLALETALSDARREAHVWRDLALRRIAVADAARVWRDAVILTDDTMGAERALIAAVEALDD